MSHRSAARYLPGGVLILLLALLTGCAALQPASDLEQAAPGRPARVELHGVPFYPQTAYQCGPAALAMALEWSGVRVNPAVLAPQVYSPARKGSLQVSLISAARRQGRIAYTITGMDQLLTEVAAGHPVIVLQNLGLSWYQVWHYAVVIGYDLPRNRIILHTGTTPRAFMSLGVFERTWARGGDWGLLVLPPDQVPVTAGKIRYLRAVLGLERARQWRAALTGYETALSHWPDSLVALMGIGNSRYALGDLAGAQTAFQAAIRAHPDAAAAYNNLAQVLADQGRYRQAVTAARRAVALGGPLLSVSQKTLKDIEARAR